MDKKRGAYKAEDKLKSAVVTTRITTVQEEYLDMLIVQGKVKTKPAAIQYIITKAILLNPKGD